MKQKFAQAVRILTTPPVFSALMCTLLYVLVPGSFASLGHYLLAIVCLSLLPVLAYPAESGIRFICATRFLPLLTCSAMPI